jgi:hypothetical protein
MANEVVGTKNYESDGVTYTVRLYKNGDFTASTKKEGTNEEIIILKNGKYTEEAKTVGKIYQNNRFTREAVELSKNINGTALEIQKGLGGTTKGIPINPAANSTGLDQDTGNPITQIAQAVGGGGLIDFISTLTEVPDIDEFGTDMAELFKEYNGILRYPLDITQTENGYGQDVLVINQYAYKSPYNDIFEGAFKAEKDPKRIFTEGVQRGSPVSASAKKKRIATVILPIPNNVADTNGVDWGSGNPMNTISMAAAGDMDTIVKMLGAQVTAKALGGVLGKVDPRLGQLAKAGGKIPPDILYALISGSYANPTFRKSLESLLLKQVGFNDLTTNAILSRGYGVIQNSNLELLFSGPTLRGFDFSYSFTPRSEEEAKMCRKILRFFKQGMAPKKKTSSGGYGGSSFLLATPNVFKLNYKTVGGKAIAGLNKFKICALTNLSTSYSDGMWAAYEDGQPVRMQFTLSFKELEPIYESDYQNNPAASYTAILKSDTQKEAAQDPVNPDEIGY